MLNSQTGRSRRHRRIRSRAARFRMLGWAALVVLVVSAAALFAEVWTDGSARPSSIFRSSPPPVEPEPEIASEPRTVFRHSVVPGGVRTAGELQAAIDSDSVVAAHHSGVTPS